MKHLYISIFIVLLGLGWSCDSDDSSNITLGPGNGATSTAGSTPGFTIINNHLYVLLGSTLKILDITDDENPPVLVNQIQLGSQLETIFKREENLFIGAEDGVYIYDVLIPEDPWLISKYVHQTGCDPVIASENFAYVTLREGNECGRNAVNQLITVDISELSNPVTRNTIDMIRPAGLAFFQGDLYVGEGIYGLKKFDISEEYAPKLDSFYTTIEANDLIGLTETLLVTSNVGVSQYQLNEEKLERLSIIK